MTEEPALLADPELRLIGELAGLAHVVDQRRRHQQVGVEPGMKLAQLAHERPHRRRVLEQAAQVGVMPAPGAWGAAKVARHGVGEEEPLDYLSQAGIVHLAGQVLEEALELLHRAIGSRQELGGLKRPWLQPAHVVELCGQLSLEALELAAGEDRVAALEAQPDAVGLAENAGRQRAGGVTQLEREVSASVARRQPVLAHTRVTTLEPPAGTQLGDRGRRRIAS